MTALASFPNLKLMNKLSCDAGQLSYEIVDLAGYLDLVERQAKDQRTALATLNSSADRLGKLNQGVSEGANDLKESVGKTSDEVERSVQLARSLGADTKTIANWVRDLGERTNAVSDTLLAVKKNNAQVDSIALQVNTLAINAKIEAARAGDSGRGFAVVAEAINELSRQTQTAANQISSNIEKLTDWIQKLSAETSDVSGKALAVLDNVDKSDIALSTMVSTVQETQGEVARILEQSRNSSDAMRDLSPNLDTMSECIEATSTGVEQAHSRIERLIDTSEAQVQASAALGGETDDAPFITYVRHAAKQVSDALDAALESGQISQSDLFLRRYKPISGTDPEQVMAPFTTLFDEILPPIQEPALEFDPKVVFCAAVDQNGYLPTHNRKFAKPQSNDPVWNAGNCRNRRIFNDRVGLKAGRNTEPFLLQVYRRDMGGGNFVMMKDLSAPIFANGQHWGGLRFAYTF